MPSLRHCAPFAIGPSDVVLVFSVRPMKLEGPIASCPSVTPRPRTANLLRGEDVANVHHRLLRQFTAKQMIVHGSLKQRVWPPAQLVDQRTDRSLKPVVKTRAESEASLRRPRVMGSNPFSSARHFAWIHLISSDLLDCEIKHKFAVWQRNVLNDLHFPIDCLLNAYRGHPRNLEFLSDNRKVAVP
jgi:hypothetical protein